MIYLILKSYLPVLITLSVLALFLFIAGMMLIFKTQQKQKVQHKPVTIIHYANKEALVDEKSKIQFIEEEPDIIENMSLGSAMDVDTIAGEDVIATKLDLARAYIETGSRELAQQILDEVAKAGNDTQQHEAKVLLGLI